MLAVIPSHTWYTTTEPRLWVWLVLTVSITKMKKGIPHIRIYKADYKNIYTIILPYYIGLP